MDYTTLLLVDDDADLLGLLQRRLEDAGYEVVVAEVRVVPHDVEHQRLLA